MCATNEIFLKRPGKEPLVLLSICKFTKLEKKNRIGKELRVIDYYSVGTYTLLCIRLI